MSGETVKMCMFYEDMKAYDDFLLLPGPDYCITPREQWAKLQKATKMLIDFGTTYQLRWPISVSTAPVIHFAQDCSSSGKPILGVLSGFNVHYAAKKMKKK